MTQQRQQILITDHVHAHLIEGLEKLGFACDYQPEISLSEVRDTVRPYHGMVINSKIRADEALIEAAENLKFIARLGSGLDIIDLMAAEARNIHVLSAPEGNCNAVAEHALGMLLTLINHIHIADQQVRQMIWKREQNRGVELDGLTVGIIGFGHTGPAFATKLRGFDVKILVFDPNLRTSDLIHSHNDVKLVQLAEIQQSADVVSLHVSLDTQSTYLVNRQFIDKMHKPFYLINTSRGKVVHTPDLLWGLECGKIKGAALDVFENEKPDTFSAAEKALYSRLYNCRNVVLTPHVAGWTVQSKWKIADVLLKKIRNITATNNS